MAREFIKGEKPQTRAYSSAVITPAGSGRTIWVAGHTGAYDDEGRPLAGDLKAQVRQTFANIEKTLVRAGASLRDIVTMTVFLTDPRFTTPMTEVRLEIFGDDFPASAAVTVTGFADPSMLVEIQCVAVID